MWYFCKYKDSLGKPKKGLHSYRVFDIAVIDVLFTLILAKFIKYQRTANQAPYQFKVVTIRGDEVPF